MPRSSFEQEPDGPTHNEVLRRDNQPTFKGTGGTPKPGTGSFVNADGINKAIPITNNTKAPGQWGRS